MFVHFSQWTALALLATSLTFRLVRSADNNVNELLQTRQYERRMRHHQKHRRNYAYLDSEAIYIALHSLARTYPSLATLESAQDKYGLPAAGTAQDCTFEHGLGTRRASGDNETRSLEANSGCKNWIFTIEDKIAYADGSEHAKRLPEVVLFGAFHGGEPVGPTVVVETASLLLGAADCESRPRGKQPELDGGIEEWKKWENELTKARECRRSLKDSGVTDDDRKWLARLVSTRRIVIVPAPNALGYYRKIRTEETFETTTDFPFNILDDTRCMQTIAARVANELFRDHMFQLAVSFHTGARIIAYPWSVPQYKDKTTPDDEALDQIATGLTMFSGKFKRGDKYYPAGTMEDLLWPIRGRMEDWAYAGSWDDPSLIPTCKPITYGGYPEEKTTYNDSMLRAFTMMVATSDRKVPKKDLGSDYNLFDPKSGGTGHISRNIRLSLMMIDVVEPYVTITKVNGIPVQDDIVPLQPKISRSCMTTKVFTIPEGTDTIWVNWDVGGAMSVSSTVLLYAKWSDLPEGFDGISQPSKEVANAIVEEVDGDINYDVHTVPGGRGKTRWYKADLDHSGIIGPSYNAAIDLSYFQEGDAIAVFAVAEVDKSWEKKPLDVSPDKPAQSHIVNARRNPDWYHESAGKIIEGRLGWYSIPVTLNIGPLQSVTAESSQRLAPDSGLTEAEKEAIDIVAVISFLTLALSFYTYIQCLKKQNQIKKNDRSYAQVVEELEQFDTHEEDDMIDMVDEVDDMVELPEFKSPDTADTAHPIV